MIENKTPLLNRVDLSNQLDQVERRRFVLECMMAKAHGYGTWVVTCPQCGEERKIRAHKYRDGRVRGSENNCHPCRAINLQNRVVVTCPSCGKDRELTRADARERLSNYCARCVRKTSGRKITGERHANKTSRGYVVMLGMRGHPLANKNYVHEHWLTLYEQHPMGPEAVLWFKEKKFTIHHKNGIRDDNRLDNLELRAPGRHPAGWTVDEMREVIARYDGHTWRHVK